MEKLSVPARKFAFWLEKQSSIWALYLPVGWALALGWGGLRAFYAGEYGFFVFLVFMGTISGLVLVETVKCFLSRSDRKHGNFFAVLVEIGVLFVITCWMVR